MFFSKKNRSGWGGSTSSAEWSIVLKMQSNASFELCIFRATRQKESTTSGRMAGQGCKLAKQEKIWSETEIAAMSMDEFDRHEAEISEAMVQGRIVK